MMGNVHTKKKPAPDFQGESRLLWALVKKAEYAIEQNNMRLAKCLLRDALQLLDEGVKKGSCSTPGING